jgi:hypothetical protein
MSDVTSVDAVTAPAIDASVPASAPADAPTAAPSSVLGSGAAPQVSADPHAWLPEKLRVFGEDGKTLNLEDSAKKMGEAYAHLEKRFGSGDVPPKSVDDYKVTVPEALADKITADDLAKHPGFKEFLGKAHAAGLTQAQFDVVTADFLQRSVQQQAGSAALDAQACTDALKAEWKSDADFNKGVQQAYKAAAAYGDVDKLMAKYGNDPDFIRVMAKVGAELGEDTGAPAAAGGMSEPDVESLQKSEAYWKPSHPDHAKTVQKVQQFYAARFGDKPRQTGGAITFTP